MFKPSYTGMVFLFLVSQIGGFGILVWYGKKWKAEMLNAIANCKEQCMIDARQIAAILKGTPQNDTTRSTK